MIWKCHGFSCDEDRSATEKAGICCRNGACVSGDDPFRKDRPQYHSYISLPLVEPTSSTVEINRYAMIGLHRIYKSGYEYRKAGVCVSELSPESLFFPDMFADSRQERIMKVMDEINGQFGNGALRLSQDDWMHRYWEPRKERMSPRYTTSWNELAVCGD